ncbi:helix-turn-helix domain-containing protein [Candidatus Accumulibacter vicinus]|uniref:HTH cro/C1-type domain-containing protein n=1 Tax=Candidatus Accumulibacter vicinus TaxID=2954382 RepID=A0A084Y2D6_9PROT|nr:helix-turn-helix domain-containing protein [Candidatus Accumulibacter vicinus]KFB68880.1 MAG: hypothetical protein CAPSK01_001735 [Candidatus Accumulibacter vicinus]
MDFKQVIEDLLAAGMTQAGIAKKVGLTPPSIVDLTSGRQKSVKWEVGDALIRLHCEKCKEAHA